MRSDQVFRRFAFSDFRRSQVISAKGSLPSLEGEIFGGAAFRVGRLVGDAAHPVSPTHKAHVGSTLHLPNGAFPISPRYPPSEAEIWPAAYASMKGSVRWVAASRTRFCSNYRKMRSRQGSPLILGSGWIAASSASSRLW